MALLDEELILPWKRIPDRISVAVDFAPFLDAGDSIVAVTSDITVFQGVDPNPTAMLVGLPTFYLNVATQKIEQGLPGVTYLLSITVTTTLGNELTAQAKQTVLQDGLNPGPIYSTHYFTTPPYPVNYQEHVGIFSNLLGAEIKPYPTPIDYVTISSTLAGAELYGSMKAGYAWDYVTISSDLVDGTLVDVMKYGYAEDFVYITSTLLGAELYGAAVPYDFDDHLTITSDLVSGTLV